MRILKIGLVGISLMSSLVAGDDIVMQDSGVVVRNGDESIILSQAADMDALVVNDKNIIINSARRSRYAYADNRVEPERMALRQQNREPRAERGYSNRGIVDMSYDSVEIKHSNQNVGTAEVPVIFELHPLTVHQYK